MANNRMFLIHRPTMIGIMLGKRMGYGWYRPPSEEDMSVFYDIAIDHSDGQSQDDFFIGFDDAELVQNGEQVNDEGSEVRYFHQFLEDKE